MITCQRVRDAIARNLIGPDHQVSYAQCGEDLIVNFVLSTIGITQISYLDIGAHHPTRLSNTYLFYLNGARGVCIEPDPELYKYFIKKRPADVCLNVGVGVCSERAADFFVMTSRTLNTFSQEEAYRYQSYGNQKIEKIVSIPLVPVNEIIETYCGGKVHFLSLDVEGLDLAILKSLDFERFRPQVLCIETLTYQTFEKQIEKKPDF